MRATWLLTLLLAAGCADHAPGRSDVADGAVTTSPDTAPADTAPTDTGSDDTVPAETASDDTAPDDTAPADTGSDDTAPAETRPADTAEVAPETTDPCAPGAPPVLAAPTATDLTNLAPTQAGTVRGLWLAPSDRPFAPGLHERLDAWLALASDFFASELARWKGEARTFTPQRDAAGRWDVVFLAGQHERAWYATHPSASDAPGEALGEIFARLPAAFHRDAIIVYFYDLATPSGPSGPDGEGGAGLADTGQGGSAAPWMGDHAGYVLMGSHVLGWGFDAVALDPAAQACVFGDTTPSGLEDWDGLGAWRPLDRGEWASTFLGASIHELGHAFGLEHVFDDADGDGVEDNLMGNGFRRYGARFTQRLPQPATVLGPTSAAVLFTHPWLHATAP